MRNDSYYAQRLYSKLVDEKEKAEMMNELLKDIDKPIYCIQLNTNIFRG